jgi:hypothetical protein
MDLTSAFGVVDTQDVRVAGGMAVWVDEEQVSVPSFETVPA